MAVGFQKAEREGAVWYLLSTPRPLLSALCSPEVWVDLGASCRLGDTGQRLVPGA